MASNMSSSPTAANKRQAQAQDQIARCLQQREQAIAIVEVRSFDEVGPGDRLQRNDIVPTRLRRLGRRVRAVGRGERSTGASPTPLSKRKLPIRRRCCTVSPAIGIPCTSILRSPRLSGSDRPILHGLCTFGYAGRHVLKAFGHGDPRRFRNIKVRFTGVVYPGETLVTRMWKDSDKRIVFETSVKERDKVVIKNAAVELGEPVVRPAPVPPRPFPLLYPKPLRTRQRPARQPSPAPMYSAP